MVPIVTWVLEVGIWIVDFTESFATTDYDFSHFHSHFKKSI